MKIYSFVAILILAGLHSKSQTYHPFIENSKIWSVANIMYYFPIPGYRIISTYSYKFTNDTLSYYGKSYYYLFECNTDPSTGSWGYRLDGYGYREENHKVFKSYYYSDTEEILYDFNLSAGDSVYIDSIYYSPTYAHITTVDSIFLDGEFRKRILFDNPPEVWIEGIGSLYSPFNPIRWCMQMGAGSLLLCASDSTGNIYMNPEYNSCYLDTTITSVTEMVKNNSIVRISNNPMHEFSDITFENQTQQFRSYNLYNSAGVLVRKDCIINSGFTLYRNTLPAGIYLLRLISKTGWQNFRIIIE